jgi:hypothetical protein
LHANLCYKASVKVWYSEVNSVHSPAFFFEQATTNRTWSPHISSRERKNVFFYEEQVGSSEKIIIGLDRSFKVNGEGGSRFGQIVQGKGILMEVMMSKAG